MGHGRAGGDVVGTLEPPLWLMYAWCTYGYFYSLCAKTLFKAVHINRHSLNQVLPKRPLTLKDGGRFKSNLYTGGVFGKIQETAN